MTMTSRTAVRLSALGMLVTALLFSAPVKTARPALPDLIVDQASLRQH